MATFFLKTIFLCALALQTAVLCFAHKNPSKQRKLLAGGKEADAGRFDSFATVTKQSFIQSPVLSGVLITPNVVLLGSNEPDLSADEIEIVAIGRIGDLEFRNVSQLKLLHFSNSFGLFQENRTYGLAVLNTSSTKAPVTIDAGSCTVNNGCLEVSAVGRGETSFFIEDEPNPDLGPNQTLQQVNFTLLDKSSCLNHFDRENMQYDLVLDYFETYYDCPGLNCTGINKTELAGFAKSVNDNYLDYQRLYVDLAEELFQSGKTTCLKDLDAAFCPGDYGAPVFTENDILVGMIFSETCIHEGLYDILPVSVAFTAGLIETIETELATLPGAITSLTKAPDGNCSCTRAPTSAPTSEPTSAPTSAPTTASAMAFLPSAWLLLLTSAMLTIRTLV